MKKRMPKSISWILRILVVLILIFVVYNFVKDRSVEKVDQTNTPSTSQIQEQITENPEIVQRAGTFQGNGPYSVTGKVVIALVDNVPVLKFDESFSSTPGPDLEVYLSKNKVASGESLGEFVSLKALQSTNGAQTYTLPPDYDQYSSVIIWCRAFSSQFGAADLAQI